METNRFQQAINKFRIMLNNFQFSEETIIQRMSEWTADRMLAGEAGHSSGIVLHTGSDCFDAALLVYAVINCILHNDSTPEEIVMGLKKGDKVLRGKATFEVVEPADEHKIILRSKNTKKKMDIPTTVHVPKEMWNQLQPYHGDSDAKVRKGVTFSEKIIHFYQSVFGMSKNDISGVMKTSVVVVAPRERAVELFKNTSLLFDIERCPTQIMLSELVTATYYTENEEYQIGENRSKNEAVIQFASDTETARQLVRNRTDNRKLGILICGQQVAARGRGDLEELMKRRQLQFSMLSLCLDFELSEWLVDTFEGYASFFSCTKNMLQQYYHPDEYTCASNAVAMQMNRQIERIIHNHVEQFSINGFMDLPTYYKLQKEIHWIASDAYESDAKNQFVIYAFSILKLFRSSVFSMQEMEETIHAQQLPISTCRNRIEQLKQWSAALPNSLREWAEDVIQNIEGLYAQTETHSPKGEQLRKWLQEAADKTVAVVVPKRYYVNIMKQTGCFDLFPDSAKLHVTTFNAFNHFQEYDLVISLGTENYNLGRISSGRLFDPLRSYHAAEVRIMMYACEEQLFRKKWHQVRKLDNKLNHCSALPIEAVPEVLLQLSAHENDDVQNIETLELCTEQLCAKWAAKYLASDLHFEHNSSGSELTEVIRLAKLDSGERVLFSKRYIAYVYSEEDNSISEVSADQLTEGDTLLFTSNNADIVDEILNKRIHLPENEQMCKFYNLSKRWKIRLSQFRAMKKWSVKEMAEYLKKNTDIPVEVQTIISWLDTGSHIVAPQNIACLRCIGEVCHDSSLTERTEDYFRACQIVRGLRKDILKEIGRLIRSMITKELPDEMQQNPLYQQLNAQAKLYTIEMITDYSENIPVNQVNRPF